MALVWLFVAAAVLLHAWAMRDYLTIVGSLGLRGAPEAATPLKQPFPAFAADAQTWVRHALSLLEGNGPQLRWTTIDNAPFGREVHWNSAWGWVIASAGLLDHWLTGRPLPQAVEQVAVWVPSLALLVLTIVVSAWVARRAGGLAGLIVGIAMVGHPRIYEGFFPAYVDHHGLLTVAVVGLCLGATLMGAGWWQSDQPAVSVLPRSREGVRAAAVASALFGAFGMWVSAASVIAPIAIVAASGFAALLVQGRRALQAGAQFDADAWRLWGRVGAAGSIFFYLVEYFPRHMGIRMEANHPFYALAWWGGAEIMAEIGKRVLGPKSARFSGLKPLLLPALAVCVAPATILIGGSRVFVVSDAFLSRLHYDHIQEFLPLWRSIQGSGWTTFFSVVGAENIPLLAGIGLLIARGTRVPVTIWFGCIAGILFTTMAWMQSRWLLNSSGIQVCLTLVMLAYFCREMRPRTRWLVGVAAAGLIFAPHVYIRVVGGWGDVKARRVSPKDAQGALWRDVALALRRSQPSGDITLLTSPNSSTAVGYFGRFKTVGTLYWENVNGLKSAAAMLAARSQDEAAALIKANKVTHVAIISEEHFIDSYYKLLHPGATNEEARKSFGLQLLLDKVVPTWLQMIPYRLPDDLAALKVNVMLFKVAFEQTPADALYSIALAKVEMGDVAMAEKDFDTLIQQTPVSYQPWLRKGELLFARQDWDGALEALRSGIVRAPANERMGLYANVASSFFRQGQHAHAAQLYEAALKEAFVPEIAAYLAFLRAASKDDQVRDGARAVELAERAVAADPTSPTFLNSLAAAQAEIGQFSKATETARRAAANAKIQNNAHALSVSEQRIQAYIANRPWRE